MAVADHQRNAGSPGANVGILFGRDRLGGIERTLVERSMGADRQRHQADQSGGNGDRAAGNPKLTYFHNLQIPISDQGTVQPARLLVASTPYRFEGLQIDAVELRSICGTATKKPLTRTACRGNLRWRMAPTGQTMEQIGTISVT